MQVATSILKIREDMQKIQEVEISSTDYIHLDIMDGNFVSNKVDMYRLYQKRLDIHLMVKDVKTYVDQYHTLHPEFITFHIEAIDNPEKMIDYIHSLDCKVGISICPDTDIDRLIPYLQSIELILIMSVPPGFGGQKFLKTSITKVNELYKMRKQYSYHYQIEVDGGLNRETIPLVNNADILVVGSFITDSENYEQRIEEIRQLCN